MSSSDWPCVVLIQQCWLLQSAVGNILTFTTPLFYGRAADMYSGYALSCGLVADVTKRCSVGCPIEVERNENPTSEEVNRLHDRYVSELVKLFESHKRSFGIPDEVNLEIL
ncbi:hypothetical protein D918_03556 [Trichuris suis]|nr:hypothetical protein D918_03556 [Trichuris suis]